MLMREPGVTTAEIDRAVHAEVVGRGAYPSTLGYSNYPRSCTISVNNVIARMSSALSCPDVSFANGQMAFLTSMPASLAS